jgi:hypothetical protein
VLDMLPPRFGKGAFDRSEVGTCTTCAPRDQAIKGSKLSSAVARAASERSYLHSVTIFPLIAYSLRMRQNWSFPSRAHIAL